MMAHTQDPTRIERDTRWRVALIGLAGDALSAIAAAVDDAGGRVTLDAPATADAIEQLTDAGVDVVVLRAASEGGARPDLVPYAHAGPPVVLFGADPSPGLLKAAARAGIAAFLIEPLQAAQLAPTLDLAVARHGDHAALRKKLAERKIVERAKGRLMEMARLTEDGAFRWLRNRAMQSQASIGDVARIVLGMSVERAPAASAASRRMRTGVARQPARVSAAR